MIKDTKIYFSLAIIVILIILVIFWIKGDGQGEVEREVAKCIGENSELYVKLGCSACKLQEEMFGKNYKYLNVVDCLYEGQKCSEAGIEYTPTWIINGEKIVGMQTIEELKLLTGC